jgi:tetratricopeptide (TPR) repeat protein
MGNRWTAGTRRIGAVAFAITLAACAAQSVETMPNVSPADIPSLERAFARDSNDLGTRVRLAEAQRRAGRAAVASRLLEPVSDRAPVAAFYLGLVREDQGRIADARRLYEGYLTRGENAALKERIRDRLALFGRLELQEAVRTALAREAELARQTPEARTVGVFPFLIATNDRNLRPLGVAFAELLSTDLGQTTRVRVVERARVQQLLDEIKLAESRRVDPASAARSGRIVGAGTLVQGRIEGANDLTFQASVVRVQQNPTAGNPLRERETVARLFDAEKRLALGVYDRLGVQLTPAERERVSQHQTRNVQALLELGLGLEAQDAGRFDEAAQHYSRATQLDPNFALARQRATEATVQARATAFSTLSLAQLGLGGLPAMTSVRTVDPFRAIERLVPNPTVRDASVEAFGTEGFGRRGTIEITIQRPPQ